MSSLDDTQIHLANTNTLHFPNTPFLIQVVCKGSIGPGPEIVIARGSGGTTRARDVPGPVESFSARVEVAGAAPPAGRVAAMVTPKAEAGRSVMAAAAETAVRGETMVEAKATTAVVESTHEAARAAAAATAVLVGPADAAAAAASARAGR
jgi:hypothetical protein